MALIDKREESMKNSDGRGGTWVRRILISIVAIAFVSAVVAAFFGKDVILEYELQRKILFFEWDKIKHVAVNGVVILKENRDAFESMVGFYFGQAIK